MSDLQPLGDPLYSVSLPGWEGNGNGHLVQALPIGSSYTPANWWRLKLASGISWTFTDDFGLVNW